MTDLFYNPTFQHHLENAIPGYHIMNRDNQENDDNEDDDNNENDE